MSETPTRHRRDEVYSGLKTSLEVLESVAKAAPVPGLEGVVAAVRGIMDIVESAKHNKQACYDIGYKIKKLIDAVHTELKDHGDVNVDQGTKRRVGVLESSLSDISHKLTDLGKENAFRRAINRVADADLINDLEKQVEDCYRNFMLGTQLAVGMEVTHLRDEAIQRRITEGVDTGGRRSDLRCLTGTRTRYIQHIKEWIYSPDGSPVCWLHGVAGSGKSSISHELAAVLHAKRRPYSCFFFQRDDAPLASSAIQLLAYGLSFVAGLRELIIKAMEKMSDTRVSPTMEEQFMALIAAPLQEFANLCPSTTVVLLIDGVDECPADIRPGFLAAIRAGVPRLPDIARVFLAGRPQSDIRASLEPLHPLEIHVDVGTGQDDGDSWSAAQIDRDASALAAKAGGLFQWASLLSALLASRVRPRDVIARVLALDAAAASTPEVNLDALYTAALDIALPAAADDPDLVPLYRQVVGAVVAAEQPLTVSAIRKLLKAGGTNVDGAAAKLLEGLGCVFVLQHVRGGGVVVRIAHPSFYDYVTSAQRCPPTWYIDPHQASVQLGSQCFALMAKTLRRDICGIGSPSLSNKDVESATMWRYVTTGLRYACAHAFRHIAGDSGNVRLLESFLEEKLLEWVEVMSLLKLLDTAVELLQRTLMDFEQHNTPFPRIELLQDAIRFLGRFGSVISKSAVHVYYSAFPFVPRDTMLYRTYSSRYEGIPRITLGHPESWPEELSTIRNLGGKGSTPRRIAFSADSSRLAVSTPTHLVWASSHTGVQLWKERLQASDGNNELPIALACGPARVASVTSNLLLRVANTHSMKEAQLYPRHGSADKVSSQSLEVTCAVFNESVDTVFVGHRDGRIQLWRKHRSNWEADKNHHPHSHSSAVHSMGSSLNLLASVSQKELKIGPYDAHKTSTIVRETLVMMPRWLADANDRPNEELDIRIAFVASSETRWTIVASLHSLGPYSHVIYVSSADDHGGRKIFSSDYPSYPVIALSPDGLAATVICAERLRRWSTSSYALLEERALPGVDSTRLDRFPVISPDGRLLALCAADVVHLWDLKQPPRRPQGSAPKVQAAGILLSDDSYIVKVAEEHQWLAHLGDDGAAKEIVGLAAGHEIEGLAVSSDKSKFAVLSFASEKTRSGLLEIVDLGSRGITTWPVALHDSFVDREVCNLEFSATGKHVAIIFFRSEGSYICTCDLHTGTLKWKTLTGTQKPLAARSLHGEELIVVRARDLWKIDMGTLASDRHELYTRDPYRMATGYARLTEGSRFLEISSRLWDKPAWYTIWDTNTIEREEARITRTIAHLETPQKGAPEHWVLDNTGNRLCCVPEEYCSKWGAASQRGMSRNRLALLNGDGAVLVVDFGPMMDALNAGAL
ncbi:hypothetical protein BC834DRAFT_866064 [Gloeopeniophorella convolvens]|nr:hypothetical protein BC834DRAFT_866064 [Gloeopeniophorella convolvens]